MAKGGGQKDGRTEGWKDGRKDGRTDGRTDGRLEIPPCVLQDIGPLGPLPKNEDNVNDNGNRNGKVGNPAQFWRLGIWRGT